MLRLALLPVQIQQAMAAMEKLLNDVIPRALEMVELQKEKDPKSLDDKKIETIIKEAMAATNIQLTGHPELQEAFIHRVKLTIMSYISVAKPIEEKQAIVSDHKGDAPPSEAKADLAVIAEGLINYCRIKKKPPFDLKADHIKQLLGKDLHEVAEAVNDILATINSNQPPQPGQKTLEEKGRDLANMLLCILARKELLNRVDLNDVKLIRKVVAELISNQTAKKKPNLLGFIHEVSDDGGVAMRLALRRSVFAAVMQHRAESGYVPVTNYNRYGKRAKDASPPVTGAGLKRKPTRESAVDEKEVASRSPKQLRLIPMVAPVSSAARGSDSGFLLPAGSIFSPAREDQEGQADNGLNLLLIAAAQRFS